MTDALPRTVLQSLNQALHQALADNPQVILLGEDILDPYGGSFKVDRGLSTAFPERVLTTPISEAGIAGMAGGMALRGMRPVVEIMFGDFATLIADQVINHIAKFHGMYNGQANAPVLIRTPMGARRGYGPTHSQTLEKLFLGTPGLTVLAPFHLQGGSELGTPGQLLYDAILQQEGPTFFVENKLQYLLKLLTPEDLQEYTVVESLPNDGFPAPCTILSLRDAPPPQITLTAYGYMAHLAWEALHNLAYDHEIFAELVVPTRLSPVHLDPVLDSLQRSGRLLAVEEGTGSWGWGAEVLARSVEALGPKLRRAGRVAAQETVIPVAADLEKTCLPQVEDIILQAREMVQA
ncbi:MAG: alpha-ketoacid dehydrogenase subunit beta [Anaerolineaceae bacterium]|nr:alpha-ketoacid dehydrogenase subunit beta [Anaerolineaceae bacterium]